MINQVKEIIKDLFRYFKCPKVYNSKLPESPKSILFICKGNICRSPFAEYVAKKIALKRSIEKMTFFSAGLEVPTSLTSPNVVHTMAEKFGINLNGHKSRIITSDMAESYDMIIAMESWHVKYLRDRFPYLRDKIYLLPLFENNNKIRTWSYHRNNIADPYGKSMQHFYECFMRIEKCIEDILSKILITL